MGYTHYWNFKKNPIEIENGKEKFKKAVNMLKKAITKIPSEIEVNVYDWKTRETKKIMVPLKLAGGDGTGEPIFNDTLVCFNGLYDKTNDYSHETCYIALDSDEEFNFCKTARKPYDVVVCLALLAFKKAFGGDFSYSSDGDMTDEGWSMASKIIKNK